MQIQTADKPSVLCSHLAATNDEMGTDCHRNSAFYRIT